MNTYSASGLILLPSLAEQDGGPLLGKYIYTRARWMPPGAGLRHPGCPASVPGSQSPQLLTPAHRSPRGCSPTLVACRDQTPFAQSSTGTDTHGSLEQLGSDTGASPAGMSETPLPRAQTHTHATNSLSINPQNPQSLRELVETSCPPPSSQLTDPLISPGSSFDIWLQSSYSTHWLVLLDIHCPSHADSSLLCSDPKHTHACRIESTSPRKRVRNGV